MTLNTLPLSYCTNVHPGRSVAEVEGGLDRYTVHVRENFAAPLAAGLWLAKPVVDELLADDDHLNRFADGLAGRGLTCHTLNAFPYGDFHSERVKEEVYIPDWSQPERLEYTEQCARVLASLLPNGVDGSLSTVPLGFKEFEHPPEFLDRCIQQLIDLSCRLDRLYAETGRRIRLAIEPEPFCVLETTAEAMAFFDRLRNRAVDGNSTETVREYLGLCYDVCHQAVEFEDVADSIRRLQRADVRIHKVHITCAIQLDDPARNDEGRRALARYVEPRYLHQAFARSSKGEIARAVDLSEKLALKPAPAFRDAAMWRVHFHVPVDAEQLGPLSTTRTELKRALEAVSQLAYSPHLEVETYTWDVLPDDESADLVDGLTRELTATRRLLDGIESDAK